MNPFEAITSFWAAQGETLMQAQSKMAEGMKAMLSGTLPAMPGGSADIATTSAEFAQANQSVMELWSAATAMAGTLAGQISVALPGGGPDATVEATFMKMMDPQAWLAGAGEMHGALGRASEAPRFADLWEVERRYLRVLKAWMELRQGSGAHHAVVLKAWMQAAQHFNEALAGKAGAEAKLSDAKAVMALWTETANREMLESQHSEAFLQSQAAMIRATTELNLAQQELVEFFGRQYGFPTRTELDDVHRTVTELRRELRALRREQRAQVAAPEPQPLAVRTQPPAAKAALPKPAVPAPRRPKPQQRVTQ